MSAMLSLTGRPQATSVLQPQGCAHTLAAHGILKGMEYSFKQQVGRRQSPGLDMPSLDYFKAELLVLSFLHLILLRKELHWQIAQPGYLRVQALLA